MKPQCSRRLLRLLSGVLSLSVLSTLSARADLVTWWTFDESAGTTAADTSPGGVCHPGFLENGAAFIPAGGRFGGAVSLDGIDDVVRVADHTGLEFDASRSFTISFWFKTTADFTDSLGFIGKGYHSVPHSPGYYLVRAGSDEIPGFDSRQTANDTPRLKFDSAAPSGTLRDGNWHHIVFVKDIAAGQARLYFDNGAPVVRTLTASADDWAMGVNDSDLYFGRYYDRMTEGQFDDTGIWNEALTAAEIDTIHQNGIAAWVFPPSDPRPHDVVVSEFMASNGDTLLDEDGSSSDWIEIWNPTAAAVSLAGWHLTDDAADLTKWTFPATTLPANGFLIVFASSKNRAVAEAELHTNFKLSKLGGTLALARPDGFGGTETVHEYNSYLEQFGDISYGLFGSALPLDSGYFTLPSPGAVNTPDAVQGFVGDTIFSIDRGFYTTTQSVAITTTTPGAGIIYTIDGTVPTASPRHGMRVDAPDASTPPIATIAITTTTQLRAVAVKSDFAPSNVDTQTYIFLADVLMQSTPSESFINWGSQGPDWEMDPEVVHHSDPASQCVIADMLEIPAISISLPFADMWGTRGIYSTRDQEVEKNCSIEYLNPNGDPSTPNLENGFHTRGTIQMVGGSSISGDNGEWKSNKLSMRIKFKPDLKGERPFDKPWIPFGAEATDRYDTLVLDARLNNTWNHPSSGQRNRAQYVRDQYAADLQNALGGTAPHGRHMHVYVCGLYWGMFTVHERPDDDFAASYFGGHHSEYDVIKHDQNSVISGDNTAYLSLHNLANQDLIVRANYEAVAAVLDLEDFARYMLVNYYIGNTDWDRHNWYATYNKVQPGAKWHFHSWDAEKGQQGVGDNRTDVNTSGGPTRLQHRLTRSPEYRLLFADLVRKELFNGGNLTPDNAEDHYWNRINIINEAVRAESARWGDNKLNLWDSPLTRQNRWLTELNWQINTYFPARTRTALGQFRSRSWYPSTDAPEFAQHGGDVPNEYALPISSPDGGTIYYTLDGSDPREAFTGSALGSPYSGPVMLMQTGTVRARVRSADGEWSALTQALFIVGAVKAHKSNLVISEIHYHPASPSTAESAAGFTTGDDFEFLELLNVGNETINLTNLRFTAGIDFDFFLHSSLPQLDPGARVLIVKNLAAIEMRYGTGHPVIGVFQNGTSLSNTGETLTLINSSLPTGQQTVQSILYDDRIPWPEAPDGSGVSLTLADAASNPDSIWPGNWRSSVAIGGSPGSDDGVTLNSWLASYSLAPADEMIDTDRDGQINLLEYALGSDPTDPTALGKLGLGTLDDGFLRLSFPRDNSADDVVLIPQASFDMIDWSAPVEVLAHEGDAPGIDRITFRSTTPMAKQPRQFLRLRVDKK